MQGPFAGAGGEPADHEPAGALGLLHLAEDGLDGLATAAMTTAEFFTERKARADRKAFRRILNRKGGEPPRPEDTLD